MEAFLDDRWEWVESTTWADREPVWTKAHCRHRDVVPVESVAGELVAHLCLTCDAQLPGGDL